MRCPSCGKAEMETEAIYLCPACGDDYTGGLAAKVIDAHTAALRTALAAAEQERDRHARGAEEYRQQIDSAKAVLGLSGGGLGLSLALEVRKALEAAELRAVEAEREAELQRKLRRGGDREFVQMRDRADALASRVSALEGALQECIEREYYDGQMDPARAALSAPAPDAAREDGAPDDMDRARAQSVGRYYAEQSPPLRSAPAAGSPDTRTLGKDEGEPAAADPREGTGADSPANTQAKE